MKRILVILLLLTLTFACASCGGTGDTRTPSGGHTDSTKKETTLNEQVCFSHGGVTVTAKSLNVNALFGPEIALEIENASAKDYTLGVESATVNDCMVTTLFSCDVAAGAKAKKEITLMTSDLKDAGITDIAQIELYFYMHPEGDYFSGSYHAPCATLRTNLFESADFPRPDSGVEIYNQGGIRIVVQSLNEGSILSSVRLCIENGTGKDIIVSSSDVIVNGYTVTASAYAAVNAGKYAIDSLLMDDDDLGEIRTVKMKFHIIDDSFSTIADTGYLTVSFD